MRCVLPILFANAPGLPSRPLPPGALPRELVYPLAEHARGGGLTCAVRVGDRVEAGVVIARGPAADLHAALGGLVTAADPTEVRVSVAPPQQAWPLPPRAVGRTGDGAIPDLPAFLARIGLLGMGGARFPAALKARASAGVGTLVVNGCECEPGITVDQAVLLHESGLVEVGARALAGALGSRRIVIAVRQEPRLAAELKRLYPDFELLPCGREYPAGAEKLILRHLTGTLPPAGVLPYQLGYLIQNAVSLRTFGRAVQDAVPSVERPLTIAVPAQGFRRDVVAPIGMTAGELLGQFGILLGPGQVLVAGGLMMGVAADAQTPIHKGTTSLVVVPLAGLRGRERDCIRCGACFDACPLDLHPVLLTEALARPPFSAATRAQMAECFLCGCCDAVCPAGIPLAQRLREGKNACA